MKIDLDDGLKLLKGKYEELFRSPLLTYEEVKSKKGIVGVYVIYSREEIIYIGCTNKFNVRFGVDMNHKTTHTIHKKLLKEGKTSEEVLDLLKNKFRYKIIECKTKVEAEALEHVAIWIERPKYNNGIYSSNTLLITQC